VILKCLSGPESANAIVETYRESEVVVLREDVGVRIIFEGEIDVAKGATWRIVTVYGDPGNPSACEAEVFLADLGKVALETVYATQLGAVQDAAKN